MTQNQLTKPGEETYKHILAQASTIDNVLKKVMKEGMHYGPIVKPRHGEKAKMVLLKPGAEKILATFHIAAEPIIEDLSTSDCIRYRVRVRGTTPDGRVIGWGVGEGSTDEEKYRWRRAASVQEFNQTDEDRRRIKYYGKDPVQQVRTHPADNANTVLKMTKKRALVDLCLTATACSDLFTQDLDEDEEPKEPSVTQPREKAPGPDKAPAGQAPSQPNAGSAQSGGSGDFAETPAGIDAPPDLTDCESVVGVIEVQAKDFTNKKTGKLGTRWGVTCEGLTMGTFDKKLGELAQDLDQTVCQVWFKVNGQYKNLHWLKRVQADA